MARGALRRGRRGQASLLQTGSLAPTCAFAVDAWGKAWQDGDVRPVVLVGVCGRGVNGAGQGDADHFEH